jgi:hypothetical protein
MALRLLTFTPADGLARIVGGMRRNGLSRFGRHYNSPGNVLVSLSQKNRLLKVSSRLVEAATA